MEQWKLNYGQSLEDPWWDYEKLSFERDRAYGFSWPPRNYKCSFCDKGFKSAQALGGHMNVHRRDRARMRLSPASPTPNSNPNPNFHISSSAPNFSPYNNSASLDQKKMAIGPDEQDFVGICKENNVVEVTTRRKESRVWKTSEFVRLDLNLNLNLGLGLIQDGKEDLDLELRLGFS